MLTLTQGLQYRVNPYTVPLSRQSSMHREYGTTAVGQAWQEALMQHLLIKYTLIHQMSSARKQSCINGFNTIEWDQQTS